MKKFISLFLIVTLILSVFAGCKSNRGDGSDTVKQDGGDSSGDTLDSLDALPDETDRESDDSEPDSDETTDGKIEQGSESGGESHAESQEPSVAPGKDTDAPGGTTEPGESAETVESAEPAESDEPATDSVQESEIPVTAYVKDYINTEDDASGHFMDGEKWYLQYTLRLPDIAVSDKIDSTVNSEILTKFYHPAEELIMLRRPAFDVNYSAYMNGDVLSVVIIKHDPDGYTAYTVNIDTSSETVLTLRELVERKGFDYSAVLAEHSNADENLFYLNGDGELVLFELRHDTTVSSGEQYYLCSVDGGTEVSVSDEMAGMVSRDEEDTLYIDITPEISALVKEAYTLGMTTGYSIARGSERVIQFDGDDPNFIQIVFETGDEKISVAVNYRRQSEDGEWKLVSGFPITVYDRSRWDD